MQIREYDYLFKFYLIGDVGAGKSSLLARFAENTYTDSYVSNVGVYYRTKMLEIDGKKILAQVWDDAPQGRLRRGASSETYRGTHAVIVVFDLTNRKSFESVSGWIKEYIEMGGNPNFILVGTKVDDETKREVTAHEIDELRKSFPEIEGYFETSAKTDKNVDLIFETAAKSVLDRIAPSKRSEIQQKNISDTTVHVIQKMHGVKMGKTYVSPKQTVDEGKSTIKGGSNFRHFKNQQDVAKGKDTDDHVIIGYTSEGLPFQVVIDGMFTTETQTRNEYITHFINGTLTPLLNKYANDLAVTKTQQDAEKVTRELIKTIYSELSKSFNKTSSDKWNAEFTMSVAMTYEREGQLYCSGFGIGNTGIAVKRIDGNVEQLAYNLKLYDIDHNEVSKDAFDQWTYQGFSHNDKEKSQKGLDLIIDRNSLFTTTMSPGDELVGYTYLDDFLTVEPDPDKRFETTQSYIVSKYKRAGAQTAINPTKIVPNKSLYDQLQTLNQECDKDRLGYVQVKDETMWGDDETYGQVVIPSNELRKKLKSSQGQFDLAMLELSRDIDEIQDPNIKKKVTAVKTQIIKLQKNGEDIVELTQRLDLTHQLLIAPPGDMRLTAIQTYEASAKSAQGKASPGWKALGIAMMVLGVAVAALGVAVIVGTFGIGAPVGIGLAVGGAALFGFGAAVTYKSRQKDLSKDMSALAKEQHKNNPKK